MLLLPSFIINGKANLDEKDKLITAAFCFHILFNKHVLAIHYELFWKAHFMRYDQA